MHKRFFPLLSIFPAHLVTNNEYQVILNQLHFFSAYGKKVASTQCFQTFFRSVRSIWKKVSSQQ